MTTTLEPAKTLALTEATWAETGDTVQGYEIHLGRTEGPDCARNWLTVDDRPEGGAASADGLVQGTYLHGLFSSDRFRAGFLAGLGGAKKTPGGPAMVSKLKTRWTPLPPIWRRIWISTAC